MTRVRHLAAILGWGLTASVGLATGGLAQGKGQPAELPPDGYAGLQYVDSLGCVFLRAGTEGAAIWVPRVSAGGKQLCGYPPSGNRVPVVGEAGAEAASVAVSEPESEPAAKAEEPAVAETYFVAVGSFGFASNVAKAKAGVEALGFPVVTGQLKGGEPALTTVFAGPFDSKAAAQDAQGRLRKVGFADAIVIKG